MSDPVATPENTSTASTPISVLLIDDHALFRSGVRSLLQRHPEFSIVGEAADGVEGLKRARQTQPDVVLLDLNMPGISGLETLQLMQQDCPRSAVLMLTVSEDAEDLGTALQARSEEHTSELQSLMRISYAVFCL